jgi:L-methionine (R)-S-oxide reductase
VSEALLDVRTLPRAEAYARLTAQLESLLEGIEDPVAVMATVSTVLHHGFGFLWTGFYRRVGPGLLRVGPYQGSLGCLEIAFGKGVCGTAAATRSTVVVPDVHDFQGHITCDPRSRSEVVVPLLDARGEVIAVLDIDSDRPAAFDAADGSALEALLERAWPRAKRYSA